MIPSPQQATIFDFVENGKGSGRVDAVAGAGKTTTLVHAIAKTTGYVAFTAYNKKIAQEISERVGQLGLDTRRVTCGTFHSFGYRAFKKAFPGSKLNDKKLRDLCIALQVPDTSHAFVTKLVSLAKQQGIGVLCPFEAGWQEIVDHHDLEDELASDGLGAVDLDDLVQEGIACAQLVLRASVEADPEQHDFDDMIYGPLVHNLKLWQNDWVFIDEAQDTNPARRALAKKMLKVGGRLLAVGDPRQAIYGFTGADSDAMDLIEREFGCVRLPLTVTYRCPKAVVRHAQQWVSHIEAHPSAPEGTVTRLTAEEFDSVVPAQTDAILCRNTKPIVALAYGFIRRGIACHVEGRDIGVGLLALTGKWRVKTLEALRGRLRDYLSRETDRFMAKGQEVKAEALADRVETLFVIMDSLPIGSDVQSLRDQISKLFQDSTPGAPTTLTLSTVHKAKGREWDRVWLYGRNAYMPSKWARQDWQLEQEDNLCYVAVTRAKQELVEVQVTAPKATRRQEVAA